MNAVLSSVADLDERSELMVSVRAALRALESNDDAGFRQQIDVLTGWRNQPLMQGLMRLARELGTAMGEGGNCGSLPEACARLEQAVKMSEDASHRTMDLIDQCRELLARVPAAPGSDAHEAMAGVRVRFSEMTAAQGYQDLTGQIIKRVVDIVRSVHEAGGLGLDAAQPLSMPASPQHGYGPAVAGLDAEPSSQDNADELLSALGL